MQDLLAFHQRFVTETACIEYLESLRWPDGPICPRCGKEAYALNSRRIYKCGSCLRQFSIRTGTLFDSSRIPLQKWFLALFLLPLYRRGGPSSVQLADRLDITQKSAWFMLQRAEFLGLEPSDMARLQTLSPQAALDELLYRAVLPQLK